MLAFVPKYWLYFLALIVTTTTVTAEEKRHPVRVAPIEQRSINREISTYGVLAPKIEDLSFRISGRIASFNATEGQTVEEGFVLAELEKRDAQDALNKAKVEVDQAQRQYERFQKLAADRLIQTAQLETALDTHQTSRITFEQAQLALERCSLRAPARGVILREYLDSRTTIAAGTPIFSFRDLSKSWVTEVELTDRNAFIFGIGTRARAMFAPYPGQVFDGVLTKQAGIADENDSLYTVEITIDSNGQALRPGMVVEIDLSHETDTIYSVVPLDALVDLRRDQGKIYVLDHGGQHVEERVVHIAAITGTNVALVETLPAGGQVVVRGQQSLRHLVPVTVL